jgi:hypothetical protein
MPGSTGGGWKRSDLATVTGVAQPTGKPAEDRPQALPSGTATAPALDPTNLHLSSLNSGPAWLAVARNVSALALVVALLLRCLVSRGLAPATGRWYRW